MNTSEDAEEVGTRRGPKTMLLWTVEEEEAIPAESIRLMAIAREYMEKPYSQYKNMWVAWDLAKEVKIRPLNDNLYTSGQWRS